MEFDLTEEQRAIKEAAREFSEKELTKDLALKFETERRYPWVLVKKAFKLGFPQIGFDEKYGGGGYTFFETVLVTEQFCRANSVLGWAIAESCGIGATLLEGYGTEEQKQKYLVPTLRGEGPTVGAFTEPSHGTDLASLDTIATIDGNEWIINGTKTFITDADVATAIAVLCQTDPKAEPTYRGQTLFLVDKNAEGLEIIPMEHKMGLKATGLCELHFDNIRVPAGNAIGELNRGFYHTFLVFNQIRILGGVRTLGMAQGAYEIAMDYAKKRETFGQTLSGYQGIRWMLAEMATKLELARLVTYKAAWLESQKREHPILSSMVKSWVTNEMLDVISQAIQILGGYGYMAEYDVERRWRDARAFSVAGGTREMALNTIARFLIDKEYKIE